MKWRLDPGQIEVVDEKVAEFLRARTPAERVAMVGQAHELARELIRGRLLTDHPDWTPVQVEQEIARRLLGESARFCTPRH